MEFPREDLINLAYDDHDTSKYRVMQNEIIDNSRWSIFHELVFEDVQTGKFYRIGYSVGATEMQDEGPFEYEGDMVECKEVHPVEKTIIVYE